MLNYLNNKLITLEESYIGKEAIIEKLVNLINENTDLLQDRQSFLMKIMEREKIGTTGIGRKIALPHARCEELNELVIAIAVLKHAIDFNTPDGEDARVIILVGAPKSKNEEYLNLLSFISKKFRDKTFRENVIEANTKDELLEILVNDFMGE